MSNNSRASIWGAALGRATMIQLPLVILAWTQCFGRCTTGCIHGLLMACTPWMLQLPGSILAEFPNDWLERHTLWRLHLGHEGLLALTIGATQFLVLTLFFAYGSFRRYRVHQ